MAKFYVQGKDGKECLGYATVDLEELSYSQKDNDAGTVLAKRLSDGSYHPASVFDLRRGYAVEGWVER